MSDQNDKSLSDKELENVAGGRCSTGGSASTSTSTSTSSSSYDPRPARTPRPTGSSYSGSSMG